MRPFASILLLGLTALLSSCVDPMIEQRISERRAAIAAEPRGDFYIGRRFYIEKTQFWGYIRRPGQPWEDSRLVMINESKHNAPDRLPEMPSEGNAHGFDHNHEYKLTGYYSGKKIYDPNSDLFLPEFVLTGWELRSETGDWIFHPKERQDGAHLLRFEKQEYP